MFDILLEYFKLLLIVVWIITARIILAVVQEVISMYGCEMIIPFYLIYWLDLYLHRSVCLFVWNYYSEYVCGCVIRSGFFVWLWNDYYLISSSLIDSLLAWICMSFLFIWIIVACIFVTVFTRSDFLNVCEIFILFIQFINWFFTSF